MTNFGLFQTEEFADIFKFDEDGRKFIRQVKKTQWENEKSLITSNFSVYQSVFKRLVLETLKNQGLFGKGLTLFLCVCSTSLLNIPAEFSNLLENFSPFSTNLELSSANHLSIVDSKSFG